MGTNLVIINETFKFIFSAEVRLKIDSRWKFSGTLIQSSLTSNSLTRAEDNSRVQNPSMRRVPPHSRMRSQQTERAYKDVRHTKMITLSSFLVTKELRAHSSGCCAGMPVSWQTGNSRQSVYKY